MKRNRSEMKYNSSFRFMKPKFGISHLYFGFEMTDFHFISFHKQTKWYHQYRHQFKTDKPIELPIYL